MVGSPCSQRDFQQSSTTPQFKSINSLALSFLYSSTLTWMSFPGGSDGKASACNVGDPGSIPGWGRSPGEGNGNPLQCSCLENSKDRGQACSPWGFLGKIIGVGCHFPLQGIFPTHGSNPGLLHCRQMLYHLSHQGSLSGPKFSQNVGAP